MKFGEVATVIFLTNQIIHHESHESVALREKTKGQGRSADYADYFVGKTRGQGRSADGLAGEWVSW
jgi:hypothetical protein